MHRRFHAAVLAFAAFALYVATLLPGLGGGDTAEFQRVGPTLGLAHSTGYPLYTLLGWAWARLLPIGGMAWRMNALSAVCAALAVGGVYQLARRLRLDPAAALLAAGALATHQTFWLQATQAEVYALATLLLVGLWWAALDWRDGGALWPVGLWAGLGLAHHRMTLVLLLPVVGAFLLAALPIATQPANAPLLPRLGLADRRVTVRCYAGALMALLLPCLLYVYVPLRAAPWQDRWGVLRDYVLARTASDGLQPGRVWADGLARPAAVFRLVSAQWTAAGMALALIGVALLLRRDRFAGLLLALSWAAVFAFCCAYYVADVAVFLIWSHVALALLAGAGVHWLFGLLPPALFRGRWLSLALLLVLGVVNDRAVAAEHGKATMERRARTLLATPLAAGALVIGDGWTIESLRYLQAVEAQRPDLEFGFSPERGYLQAALERNRAVYLLQVTPDLGLQQTSFGAFFQVNNAPLVVQTAADLRWDDGLRLMGFTLAPGPYRPSDAVPLTLAWAADTRPQAAYTLFVHLVAADGTLWGQQDRPPATTPTDQWQPGSTTLDLLTPTLAADAPPGRYRVLVGWYSFPSLARLPRSNTPAQPDIALIGEIEVVR